MGDKIKLLKKIGVRDRVIKRLEDLDKLLSIKEDSDVRTEMEILLHSLEEMNKEIREMESMVA